MRKASENNPKGHFELDLLYAINQRLMIESFGGGRDITDVCEYKDLAALAEQRARYFHLFLAKFNGDLCKDPLFCITLPFWKKHWPEQRKTIFCMRHPYSVAQSMVARYGLTERQALEVWRTYTERFFDYIAPNDVYIIDFDRFVQTPLIVFSALLNWLEQPIKLVDVQAYIEAFFNHHYVSWNAPEGELTDIYHDIMPVYLQVKQQAASLHSQYTVKY